MALLYTSAFSDFGSIAKVHDALTKEGVNVGATVVEDRDTLALVEAKYLGTAITNIHPLMKTAKAYVPVTDFQNGDRLSIAAHIIDMKNKVTKNKKPYVMAKIQCLNSMETVNVFDWANNQIGLKKGEYRILHIQKNNDFYNLVMDKNYSGSNARKKQTLYGKTTGNKLKKALKK